MYWKKNRSKSRIHYILNNSFGNDIAMQVSGEWLAWVVCPCALVVLVSNWLLVFAFFYQIIHEKCRNYPDDTRNSNNIKCVLFWDLISIWTKLKFYAVKFATTVLQAKRNNKHSNDVTSFIILLVYWWRHHFQIGVLNSTIHNLDKKSSTSS